MNNESLAKNESFFKKYKNLLAAVALLVLIPTSIVAAQSAFPGFLGASINCLVENSCNFSFSGSKAGEELKFGSGTEQAIFGGDIIGDGDVSSTAAVMSFNNPSGVIATTTFSGVTTTQSFAGRTCMYVRSPTGTLWSVTFENGTFNSRLGNCSQ